MSKIKGVAKKTKKTKRAILTKEAIADVKDKLFSSVVDKKNLYNKVKHLCDKKVIVRQLPIFDQYLISEDCQLFRSTKDGGYVKIDGHLDRAGYPRYTLSTSKAGYPGQSYPLEAHRLVALAFIGPRPYGYDVAHNDGTKHNNHYTNLRYATRAENMADMRLHGTTRAILKTESEITLVKSLIISGLKVPEVCKIATEKLGKNVTENVVRKYYSEYYKAKTAKENEFIFELKSKGLPNIEISRQFAKFFGYDKDSRTISELCIRNGFAPRSYNKRGA